MADFRMQILFGAQTGGWTESWFLSAVDFNEAIVKTFAYMDARAQQLGQGAFIDAYRITNVLSPGQVEFSDIPPKFTQDRRVPGLRDVIQTTILLRMQSETGCRRMFQMSGLADDSVVFDVDAGKMVFTPFARTRAEAFVNACIQIPVRIYGISKSTAAVQLKLINAIDIANTGVVTVVSNAHGYAVDDIVRISRVPNAARPFVTGVWTITSVLANSFTFVNPDTTAVLHVGAGGIVRRQRKGFESIVSGGPLRVANRKRGRAFFLPVGRRSAR